MLELGELRKHVVLSLMFPFDVDVCMITHALCIVHRQPVAQTSVKLVMSLWYVSIDLRTHIHTCWLSAWSSDIIVWSHHTIFDDSIRCRLVSNYTHTLLIVISSLMSPYDADIYIKLYTYLADRHTISDVSIRCRLVLTKHTFLIVMLSLMSPYDADQHTVFSVSIRRSLVSNCT